MWNERAARHRFIAACTLLFALSATATVLGSTSMPRHGMPMPGGWTMSMAWMRMPGQSTCGFAAMFIGMWIVMMIAMMLPSLAPMLWRQRVAAVHAGAARTGRFMLLAGGGYLLVWSLCGLPVFALGVLLASIAMQSPVLARAAPLAAGVVVVLAGALQFSRWKAHHLACCRPASACTCMPDEPASAWWHGVRFGLRCCQCCAGLTATLLVAGVMDLPAMALVTLAITAERLAPDGQRVARSVGVVLVGAGVLLLAYAGIA
jgi:predicted metal-binding membrane protein